MFAGKRYNPKSLVLVVYRLHGFDTDMARH
jgi:hypothetical protein